MKSFLIGSLPHKNIEEALAYSFSFTIPTLVTLPKLDENEFMVDQAMREIDGYELVRHSLRKKSVEYKSPLKFLSADLFFKRGPEVYKWQACGPLTLLSSLDDHPKAREILEKYFDKIALTQRQFNQRCNGKVYFFLDEPSLAFCENELGLLKTFLERLRRRPAFANISFGLHSCSKASLETLKSLPFDLYALDPSLYSKEEWEKFQKELKEKLIFAPIGSRGEKISYPPKFEVFASPACGQALTETKFLGDIHSSLTLIE